MFVLFTIFWVIQLTFVLLFELRILLYKSPQTAKKKLDNPLPVSVIVASHNDRAHLAALLEALAGQEYPCYEVILVDDRSSPPLQVDTDDKLRLIRIERLPQGISGKKHAIKTAIQHAQYAHLLFTDADCLPSSKFWIQSMMSRFDEDTDIVLGVSPYLSDNTLLNKVIQSETLYTMTQYLSYWSNRLPYMGVGRNLAYRHELFVAHQGFQKHSDIIGGDDDLFVGRHAHHDNTNIAIIPDSWVYSYPKTSWKSWIHQKTRHIGVSQYYRPIHKMILGMQTLSHLGVWVLGIVLSLSGPLRYYALAMLIVRVLSKSIVMKGMAKKMHHPLSFWELAVFDFFYCFYLGFIGTKAMISPVSRWR